MKDTAIKSGTYCPVCKGVGGTDCWHNASEFNVPRTDHKSLEKISELQARVAELEAENARLSALCDKWNTECDEYREDNKQCSNELILAQAEIKRLTDRIASTNIVLEAICAVNPDSRFAKHELYLNREALAQPSDTSVLDAYVDEKVKEETDEYAALIDRLSKLLTETAVALKGEEAALTRHSWHDLPVVALSKMAEISELARQRDLAVEAMENAFGFCEAHATQSQTAQSCVKQLGEAIYAIKESEVT